MSKETLKEDIELYRRNAQFLRETESNGENPLAKEADKIADRFEELLKLREGLCEHCECKLYHERSCRCCNEE